MSHGSLTGIEAAAYSPQRRAEGSVLMLRGLARMPLRYLEHSNRSAPTV